MDWFRFRHTSKTWCIVHIRRQIGQLKNNACISTVSLCPIGLKLNTCKNSNKVRDKNRLIEEREKVLFDLKNEQISTQNQWLTRASFSALKITTILFSSNCDNQTCLVTTRTSLNDSSLLKMKNSFFDKIKILTLLTV